mmetsp:Transcript_27153/g.91267  ORF Transcript_27153/g.91267 Transcript_27153/m.91267 type:complete len:212 (+) Transcript_27153:348-983(+)
MRAGVREVVVHFGRREAHLRAVVNVKRGAAGAGQRDDVGPEVHLAAVDQRARHHGLKDPAGLACDFVVVVGWWGHGLEVVKVPRDNVCGGLGAADKVNVLASKALRPFQHPHRRAAVVCTGERRRRIRGDAPQDVGARCVVLERERRRRESLQACLFDGAGEDELVVEVFERVQRGARPRPVAMLQRQPQRLCRRADGRKRRRRALQRRVF